MKHSVVKAALCISISILDILSAISLCIHSSSVYRSYVSRAEVSSTMALANGKHVMLSHDGSGSRDMVGKIHDILKAEHIPVWFDRDVDSNDHLYKRYEHPWLHMRALLK